MTEGVTAIESDPINAQRYIDRTEIPHVDPLFVAELQPYQLEGIGQLEARLASNNHAAFLSNKQGLGKTKQSLAVVLRAWAPNTTILISAPKSVCQEFKKEIVNFNMLKDVCEPGKVCFDWDESAYKSSQMNAQSLKCYAIILISHPQLKAICCRTIRTKLDYKLLSLGYTHKSSSLTKIIPLSSKAGACPIFDIDFSLAVVDDGHRQRAQYEAFRALRAVKRLM